MKTHVMMCTAGDCNGHVGIAERGRRGVGRGIRMVNKEPRGSRAGRIGYEKRAGRGRNILQEAGKPQDIV